MLENKLFGFLAERKPDTNTI